ncbi:uncharacterized protein LOC132386447 [Hypanus sabinus]|uniref:uncharacterized protein LOC132386447 n=1 Tax=Hypanus sabinus TaxID=79690 RepID=UPI0028C37AE0|nr:uncharacterized protein LOC132386447 [Hypanus sabinus]
MSADGGRRLEHVDDTLSVTGRRAKSLQPAAGRRWYYGIVSIYSVLSPRKDELLIDDYEELPTASGSADRPMTAQAAAHELEPKERIGSRPYRLICLLCLVTSALIVIVAGLSIHVSQIRQSKVTSDRKYHELNSTLQSQLSELNSNLSELKRMHRDLRHQFTDIERKYRSVNENKAQICELLTSRREQTCSKNWMKNRDRCYYVSTFETSSHKAMHECSSRKKLLVL